MYHVYHYWKQSVDDVTAPGLSSWVGDTLGLSFIASKIKEIARVEPFSERMLTFLRITPYFSEEELTALSSELLRWERRLEWETYKERADDLISRGEPDKAITLYRRALQYDENVFILNNLGVAYMQVEAHGEACRCFKRAIELEADTGNGEPAGRSGAAGRSESAGKSDVNWKLMLHYSEALIAHGRFDEALRTISTGTGLSGASAPAEAEADILYLRGELAAGLGNTDEAIEYLEQAIAISCADEYVFRLADIYASRRQFEKALEVLSRIKGDKPACLMKVAEMHNLSDNLPAAITAIKKAIVIRPGYGELWVRLARYHRLNYDLPKAEEAIIKALTLDASSERARLEAARIQKNMGKTKAYQELLKGILAGFKSRYREVN